MATDLKLVNEEIDRLLHDAQHAESGYKVGTGATQRQRQSRPGKKERNK